MSGRFYMADRMDVDIHLVVHAQDKRARVLESPLHVRHDESEIGCGLSRMNFDGRADRNLVRLSVQSHHAIDQDLRLALGRHLAANVLRSEGELRILGAFQNLFVHLLIASVATAIATRRVYYEQTTCCAVQPIEANGSTLHLEGSMDRVQNISEGERNLTLVWIELERVALGGGCRNRCERRDYQQRESESFHFWVHIGETAAAVFHDLVSFATVIPPL